MIKQIVTSLVLSLMWTSCFHEGTATRVVDNYFIATIGDNSADWLVFGKNSSNSSGEGIVVGVEAVGYNDSCIFVKCSMESFYIIEYKMNKRPYFDKEFLIGPMDRESFEWQLSIRRNEDFEFSIYP